MSEAAAAPARPRAWQMALLLNVFFPPAGYAYVGAWRTVGVFAALVMAGMVAITEWTVAFPPGMYGLGVAGVVVLALCLAVALGVHAAWIAEDAAPKSGSRFRHAVIYGATSLAVLTTTQLFRAYWPHAFYSFASNSMIPSLRDGDILAVQGARAACDGAAPKRGDVVLYQRGGSDLFMHRVVAGPGQTVAMKAGQLIVDGRPVARNGVSELPTDFGGRPTLVVEETLPDGRRYQTQDEGPDGPLDTLRPTRVPDGAWYVLGDNRDNVADSRVRGPVDGRNLCGIAFRIMTSGDKRRVGQQP